MPKRSITVEDLYKIVVPKDAQISPDGQRVLFTKQTIGSDESYKRELWSVSLDGTLKQWTSGPKDGMARWSPDGTQIAFVSGRDDAGPQIYLLAADGGEAGKLTDLPTGTIAALKWSPDGKKIAIAFRPAAEEWSSQAQKERKEKKLPDPPLVLDSLWYRLDGDGYFAMQRIAIYVVDVESGEHSVLIEEPVMGVSEFDWSPGSDEIVVIHTTLEAPFREPNRDAVTRVNLEGQTWRIEELPAGRFHTPCWSPDGRWIAFLGLEDEQGDSWFKNTRLFVIPAEGGGFHCLTANDDIDISTSVASDLGATGYSTWMGWDPDSKGLYFNVSIRGEMQLARTSLENSKIEVLTSGHQQLVVESLSRDGNRFGVVYGTATKPFEIGVYETHSGSDSLNLLTRFNQEFLEQVEIIEPEEIYLDNGAGGQIHAWCILPHDFLPPKRYPAVLEVHGGPHLQYGWAYFHEFQVLAASGYVVVFSNPRGSNGYGEEHTGAIKGDWGGKDWEDIQTVSRWMESLPFVHPGRIGIMGGSYGGYMTNWAISHSDRYRAAISDRCVSNLVSKRMNTDFPGRPNQYFEGTPWGDHESIRELWRMSPIAYFENVNTPTLIIHSEGDLRCNVEQSEQVFTALQQRGIPSRFVRYPRSCSHGLSRSGPPSLRLHRLHQILDWWQNWL
jgi:acylaminoacyl-peptidase